MTGARSTAGLTVAPMPDPSAQLDFKMDAESAQRFQTALQWATSRLARSRGRGDLAVEHLRWLDWGSCVIAGGVGIAPPAPQIEAVPELVLAPGEVLLDARGRRRPASTLPGNLNPRKGVPPKSKGRKYEPDPPTVDEIVLFLQTCPDNVYGRRMQALVILLWRSGLRISEAVALEERDLRAHNGELVVRHGKGDKRRIAGMDPWGWQQVMPWVQERMAYPPGPVFCVLSGPTAGRAWGPAQVRFEMRRTQERAGIRRRFRPHQLRHLMVIDWVREGRSLVHLQRQVGHSDLGVTTRYTSSLSPDEVIAVSADRRAPVMPVPDLSGAFRGE